MSKDYDIVASRVAKRIAAGTVLVISLTMSGCAGTPTTLPSAEEAGLFTRDVQVCFTNSSGLPVTIKWNGGISTSDGEGTLDGGETICGEGSEPRVIVTTSDLFQTELYAGNPDLKQPRVGLYSVSELCAEGFDYCQEQGSYKETFAYNTFSEGQNALMNAGGHEFSVTRGPNDSWVNFSVEITS